MGTIIALVGALALGLLLALGVFLGGMRAEVADAFTSSDRAMGALFGTTHCLRLRPADAAA